MQQLRVLQLVGRHAHGVVGAAASPAPGRPLLRGDGPLLHQPELWQSEGKCARRLWWEKGSAVARTTSRARAPAPVRLARPQCDRVISACESLTLVRVSFKSRSASSRRSVSWLSAVVSSSRECLIWGGVSVDLHAQPRCRRSARRVGNGARRITGDGARCMLTMRPDPRCPGDPQQHDKQSPLAHPATASPGQRSHSGPQAELEGLLCLSGVARSAGAWTRHGWCAGGACSMACDSRGDHSLAASIPRARALPTSTPAWSFSSLNFLDRLKNFLDNASAGHASACGEGGFWLAAKAARNPTTTNPPTPRTNPPPLLSRGWLTCILGLAAQGVHRTQVAAQGRKRYDGDNEHEEYGDGSPSQAGRGLCCRSLLVAINEHLYWCMRPP